MIIKTLSLAKDCEPGIEYHNLATVSSDKRPKRDLHALNEDGMLMCNPRDKEAAHRAQTEGIATYDWKIVTCRKCLSLVFKYNKASRQRPKNG